VKDVDPIQLRELDIVAKDAKISISARDALTIKIMT
jgi:hypothetical protein